MPTDGLWDEDRTDEQQIGATYSELEWAMGSTVIQRMIFQEEKKEVFQIYDN